ncbi:coproporphyrinogen III oxidase [Candidatus Magnetomorum sp. HK-1]|nr:coproporphyrinogen III oxidase [Candidatus Magnetomorum sp. HK-1]
MSKLKQQYTGFEQGPIRPPSEASSLLIRVTRNCPWNHCAFCPVYKGTKFSLRPVDHIIRDIDQIKLHIQRIKSICAGAENEMSAIQTLWNQSPPDQAESLHAAINWFSNGIRSVFIQDANSLIIKPAHLVQILSHLRECFPEIQRITSYARSHTIARISQNDLKAICDAGLNRIHIGLESGSDAVLKIMKKGVTKKDHINAGIKVKDAGMELSEYVMPGLGGQALTKEHALETADALNQINPDFIRLRSLAIPSNIPLFEMAQKELFVSCTDEAIAHEIHLMISNLKGIQSFIASDHILNLFEDIHGKLPNDQDKMLSIINNFFNLSPLDRTLFQVGRRLGIFRFLSQLEQPSLREQVQKICTQMNITPDNVDQNIQKVIQRFI